MFSLFFWLLVQTAFGYTVAVLPFTESGQGSEFEGIGLGLQSMVTTDLSQASAITVVERERLQDLLREMELVDRGLVDPATAVQVGKIVNATHVVTGSFSAVGATMRLDARLAHVETGKVEVGKQIVGSTEEFFELEKALVQQLIEGMGAELSKIDARKVQAIQSYDFENFAEFSRGVALFDAERYAESQQILEQVARKEPSFTSATVTLAQIREARARAEAKAAAIGIQMAEEAFVVHQASARTEAEWLTELRKLGTDPTADWRDRSSANIILAAGLTNLTSGRGFHALRASADEFAVARMGDQAYQRLWSELRPKVPEWFPYLRFPTMPKPDTRYDLAYVLEDARDDHFDGSNHNYLLSSCGKVAHAIGEKQLEALWVPQIRRVDLRRELLTEARGCMGDQKYLDQMDDLADRYLRLGEVAKATSILTHLSSISEDPRVLQNIASSLADAEARQQELDTHRAGTLQHEGLRFAPAWGRAPSERDLSGTPERTRERVHYYLRNRFPHAFYDPLFVNGLPVWLATAKGSTDELSTDRRTGPDEFRAFRHYRDTTQERAEGPLLAVLGAPRTDLTARVTVNYTPASDWWPRVVSSADPAYTPRTDRPTAGLVVGLVEIATKPVCDPVDESKITPIPATGVGALVHDGNLVIATLTETWNEPDRCRRSNAAEIQGMRIERVHAKKPMRRAKAEIVVTVAGRKVTARAGGTTVTTTLDRSLAGFVGLYADGEGYVELAAPAWE